MLGLGQGWESKMHWEVAIKSPWGKAASQSHSRPKDLKSLFQLEMGHDDRKIIVC